MLLGKHLGVLELLLKNLDSVKKTLFGTDLKRLERCSSSVLARYRSAMNKIEIGLSDLFLTGHVGFRLRFSSVDKRVVLCHFPYQKH